jgi:hypothetical protein
MMELEREIFKAQAQFERIVETLRQAAVQGQSMDQTERELWQNLLGMGRTLVQGFVDSQGSGDLGPTLAYEGQTLRRLDQLHERRYVSVFGEIHIVRTIYGSRESQKHVVVPLDARLNLPDSDFSYLLQEWNQAFCVQGSYQQSCQTVERILGIGQSVRSLEHMNQTMALAVEGFRQAQPAPAETEAGGILVLTADGKGVPMRRPVGESSGSGERRKKGEKANSKRQACVGAVYTIDPFSRCAADVVNEVMRHEQQEKRPRPCDKRMRAELSREIGGSEVNGKDMIFRWFVQEIELRNGERKKPVVCVMDGERALWKKLQEYIPQVVCVLDLYHVLERLWTAAYCFCAEGSEAAQSFVTERLERILQGEVGRVIGGLKQMATKQRLTGSKKKQLYAVITYLENHRQLMNYDYFLDCGYPIGSGVAEGACRHLVKDRMELAGMRWKVGGAQAMLDLRTVYLNGDWEAFQEYRIHQEEERLYPDRDWIQAEWALAA